MSAPPPPSSAAGRPRTLCGVLSGALRAGLPALCLLGAGCRSPEWALYNLRETHELDGSIRRVGRPYGPLEYAFAQGFRPMGVRLHFVESERDGEEGALGEPIEDPLELSLEALVALQQARAQDTRTWGLRVEAFTWLATSDPYVLGRERCLLGLKDAALALGGIDGPRRLGPDEVPAGVEEVTLAARALVRAAGEALGAERAQELDAELGPDAEDAVAPAPAGLALGADLRGACAEASALVLDGEGARRLLAVCNALLGFGRLSEDETAAIEELSIRLQRRCIEEALSAALDDEAPLVRAAALEACVVASGNRLPSLSLAALSDPSPLVHLEAIQLIQEHGLPVPPEDMDPANDMRYRDTWYTELLAVSLHRDPRVGVAACKALGLVTGSDLRSLRAEDWAAWAEVRFGGDAGLVP